MYTYKGLDKLTEVTENGKVTGSYTYYAGGQLASATQGGKTESFLWDGLALIARGETSYLNEPAATGGNPIAAGDQVLFNDLLGSTLGRAENGSYTPGAMTAFGETTDAGAFFTGKPAVGDLGYTFLFRNYRPTLGKWQTSDPLGYPDGWNNFAYVNNSVTSAIDIAGGEYYQITISLSAIAGGGVQGNFGFTYDANTGNVGITGGTGGGIGCNISASIGITVGQGSPSESSTVVSIEGGGGALGNLTIVASSDSNGNLSGGGSLGVSLTPVNGNVAISQQWNETLFNTNDIADAINSVYDPNDGWLSGFFYDLFYRSGNDPVVILE